MSLLDILLNSILIISFILILIFTYEKPKKPEKTVIKLNDNADLVIKI